MVKACAATLAVFAAVSMPASATVLAVGHGVGDSPEAARAAARDDLALRLQRRAEVRLEGARGDGAASVRRAIAGGRELPLISVKLTSVGAKRGAERYEARLTDASLTAYRSEAGRLAQRLRAFDPVRLPGPQRTAEGIAEWLAHFDQHQRINAVLISLSPTLDGQLDLDDAKLWSVAVKTLSPVGGQKDVAQVVKRALDRAGIAGVRVIAPVRANTPEVTPFAASLADEIRSAISVVPSHGTATHTLDGSYVPIDGRLLLTLFLLDASFNTRRAFVFVLPADAERGSTTRSAVNALAETLSRGLVRVEMPGGSRTASSSGIAASDGMEVSVRMGRGHRGLYYRPGDRDRMLVKTDRPGYYYIVGHVEKAGSRLSYLMEIGKPGATNRFVRRVEAGDVHRWLNVGEFKVEAPSGFEAVQVFATSMAPERLLPATRFDSARNLHLIGDEPAAVATRTRGLVRVNLGDPRKAPRPGAEAARFAVGEAVLQFSTLQ